MSQQQQNPATARLRFADRLEEAGLSVVRFIDVLDGSKASHDHTLLSPDSDRLTGNYGVYAGRGDENEGGYLIDVDVDDYGDGIDEDELAAVNDLPSTFSVESPHTNPEKPGHRYYVVDGDPTEIVRETTGDDKDNFAMSCGEIRIKNQYVVGPGSQLDGCDKDWCDECADPDGGRYRIGDDRPIATISESEFRELIEIGHTPTASIEDENEDDQTPDTPVSYDGDGTDPSSVLQSNPWIGEYLALGQADDRSEMDYAVCVTLAKNGVDRADARELLNSSTHTKVHERGRDYWDRTWKRATQKAAESEPSTAGIEDDGIPKPTEFVCRNSCYGYTEEVKNAAREVVDEKWTNATTFELEARSFIVEDDGATVTVELTVHPASNAEPPYEVTVPIDVFSEPRTFRQEVATGRTTTYDLGGKFLNKIRRFVGGQDAPIRVPTRHIGLHGTEFVTPDGVITADGWDSDPSTVLIDNDTTLPQKWVLTPDDGLEYDEDDVAEILELLPQTRDADRFLPVLGWFYAAPVRPLIMQWTGEFNVLNITGDTGAGKTATLGVLWELFGMDGEPLSAEGTAFTRMTPFASSNAVPVWFDEFKPAEMADKKVDTFMSLLRKSTRGGTEPRGNADQTEDQWQLRAPVVVSGEQLIAGPAEERRSIQTVFSSAVTDDDTDEFRHFARLSGGDYVDESGEHVYCEGFDLLDHARGYYTWLLGGIEDGDTLERQWKRAGERVTKLLADHGMNVHPTVKQGYQTVLFGSWLYRGFCDHVGADASRAGVTDDRVLQSIVAVADTGTGHEHVSHLERLLGVASRAAAADYLEEGEHYKVVVPRDREGEELRLKLPIAFDAIRRYTREYDVADGDLLDSAGDYRTRIKDAEDSDDSVVRASSVKTYGLSRTCAFSIPVASDRIEDFERYLWTNEGYDPSTGEGTDLTPKQAVESVVTTDGAMNRPALLAKLAERFDIDPETGGNAIEAAVTEGRVVERSDDMIHAE